MVNSAWAGHARWVCSRAGGTRTPQHPPPPGSQVACPSLPLLPPLGRFEHTHPTPFPRRVHSTTEGHLGVHPLFWRRARSEGGARCSKCAKTPAVQCRWTAVHGERGSVCPSCGGEPTMHHGAGPHPTNRLGAAALLRGSARGVPPLLRPPGRIHCRHTHHRHRQLGLRVSHSGTTVDGPRPDGRYAGRPRGGVGRSCLAW